MIPFNKAPFIGSENTHIKQAFSNLHISGDGQFTRYCNRWFEEQFSITKALLTTSCTHALEMAAILAGIKPGDEVIAPSFTFVSTVNAFVLRGAKIKFVDIRPDTMNIDENLIEQAITERTKVIIPVHYAGVACEMDTIMAIAKKHRLLVIEDAAQGVMSTYKGFALGSIGAIGTFSFHETKNYTMGEGGAILINDARYIERAEIIREKGTNRSKFFRGEVDKYTWVDIGSSYLPSELNAAYLWAQLEIAEQINNNRIASWKLYNQELTPLAQRGLIELPYIPAECEHNAHMFYIKVKNLDIRTKLAAFLKENGILAIFHYVPLHTATAGYLHGKFIGEDIFTTKESERLLRLPMYYNLSYDGILYIVKKINLFFNSSV